jgi:hypothetical protein
VAFLVAFFFLAMRLGLAAPLAFVLDFASGEDISLVMGLEVSEASWDFNSCLDAFMRR